MVHLIQAVLGIIVCQILYAKSAILKGTKNAIDEDLVSLSIIIPARNEEHSLPKLLASLMPQRNLIKEIIVVDDHSTDNTIKVAKLFDVSVIEAKDRDVSWVGKSYACFEGVKNAKGNVYLFVDADTIFEEGAIACLMSHFLEIEGALSVQPFHTVHHWFEQCSLFFNLILVAGMHSFSIFSNTKTAIGLFGPVIMISKHDYEKIGGHKAVKNQVIEDLALGQLLRKQNIPLYNYLGGNLIGFKMYDNFNALMEGWTKNFASGATTTSFSMVVLIFVWICGCLSIYYLLLHSPNLVIAMMLYVIYVQQLMVISQKIGSFKKATIWLFPVFLFIFISIFVYSLIKTYVLKTVKWKGRPIKL
ncbi:MAG: glycosyltransferase [Turicibacter sp.]